MKPLKIKVEIAGLPYRVNIVGEDEEEIVRAAAKSVNAKIELLQGQFKADIVRYVSMAALQEAVEKLKAGNALDHRVDLLSIDNINSQVESCIKACELEQDSIRKELEKKDAKYILEEIKEEKLVKEKLKRQINRGGI